MLQVRQFKRKEEKILYENDPYLKKLLLLCNKLNGMTNDFFYLLGKDLFQLLSVFG